MANIICIKRAQDKDAADGQPTIRYIRGSQNGGHALKVARGGPRPCTFEKVALEHKRLGTTEIEIR